MATYILVNGYYVDKVGKTGAYRADTQSRAIGLYFNTSRAIVVAEKIAQYVLDHEEEPVVIELEHLRFEVKRKKVFSINPKSKKVRYRSYFR